MAVLCSCNPVEKNTSYVKPNVILFLIDDYGYGDISAEGNTQIKTPNIDRIADQGARFSRFYQCSGACAPTRASLLTGRYHLETGVWGVHFGRDFLHRDENTIGDLLQRAGYTTGAFGKWHSGKTWSYFSWNRGFDVGIHPVLYRYWDTKIIFNNKLINVDGPVTDVVGDQVVKFIRDNRDRPFFAYVPFQSIHEPFNCPDDVFQKYKKAGYSDHVARMYGMTEVMDKNVGKILNTVDALELTDNTVIMFLVDDGPSPGCDLSYANRRMNKEEQVERERGWGRILRGGKGTIYEGGSISPFYIKWKNRIVAGSEIQNLTGVIDLLPTILDICDADIPDENLPIHGKSFWPVLQGKGDPDWEARKYYDNTNFYRIPRWTINMEHPEMRHISVHYKNFKMIRTDRTHSGKKGVVDYFLYDLSTDPQEKNNVFEKFPEVGEDLQTSAEKWYEDILARGRAFPQAVYEIGNWEERGSPINLDAVLEIKGSVKKSERSEFRFDGWTTPGSAMTFEIDVVEDGRYVVEMLYDCPQEALGSEFQVYTKYDKARVVIKEQNSAYSDTLDLPAGRQQLTVELVNAVSSQGAVDVMRSLVVHRIPGLEDEDVLINPGFNLLVDDENPETFPIGNDVVDFGRQDKPIPIDAVKTIRIETFADNPDQIKKVEVFVDFESVAISNQPPFDFDIPLPGKDKFTVNVEFTSANGVKNAARAFLVEE